MKTVFNNEMVAHVWAQQNQEHGRNTTRSIYFEGDTIYSYGPHFPIACFVNDNTVLFTTKSYGNSTSKHICYARRALSNDINIIHVLDVRTNKQFYNKTSDHQRNIDAIDSTIQDFIDSAKQATKYASSCKDSALSQIENRQAYIDLFSLDYPIITISKEDNEIIDAKIERTAVLEATARDRAVKKANKDIEEIYEKNGGLETICNKWRDGENFNHNTKHRLINALNTLGEDAKFPTMLRVTSDGESIESSQGARVNKVYGLRAMNCVLAIAKTLDGDECREVSKRMDHFTIDKVYKDRVIIGCHVITMNEVELLKTKLEG